MKAKTITLRAPRVLAGAMLVAGMIVGNLAAMPSASAANGEAIWDGDAGDFKFSSAANWEGDTLPVAGDVLKFNDTTPTTGCVSQVYKSDIDVTFGGLEAPYDASNCNIGNYIFDGTMSFNDGATISARNSYITNLVGLGGLRVYGNTVNISEGQEVDGKLYNRKISVNGTLIVNSGVLALNPLRDASINAGKYQIEEDAILQIGGAKDIKVTEPVILTRSSQDGNDPSINAYRNAVIDSVTLNTSTKAYVYEGVTLEVKNLTSNGYSLTRTQNSLGTLITPEGTQATNFEKKTSKLDGDKSTEDYTVVKNETAILSGSRNYMYVMDGGILKGTGVANTIQIAKGGVVSPGTSPGTLKALQFLSLGSGSSYQAEIKNLQEYDKIVVGNETEGYISIDGSILDLSLLDGADIKKGDTFTIIDFQRAGEAINGTFKDLPEGTKIVVGDAVFSISYKGGDGNDVVLTALNDATTPAPGTPNTGVMELVRSNPAVVALAGIVAAAALVAVKRRQTQR